LLDNRDGGVFRRSDAEEELVFGVVLAAEAGEVLVRIGIEALDGLDIADRGSKRRRVSVPALATKESPGTEDADGVVKQRKRRYQKNEIRDRRCQILTSYRIKVKCGFQPKSPFMRLLQLTGSFQFSHVRGSVRIPADLR
jgi:hypothetical protein